MDASREGQLGVDLEMPGKIDDCKEEITDLSCGGVVIRHRLLDLAQFLGDLFQYRLCVRPVEPHGRRLALQLGSAFKRGHSGRDPGQGF